RRPSNGRRYPNSRVDTRARRGLTTMLHALASGHIKSDRAHRAAIWRHLASIRFVICFTLASSAAQNARLTAAVRYLGGPRLATCGAFAVPGGSETKGTEAASAKGEPAAAKCARARPQ